ncbi:hypothetical protein [Saccharopolyspora pogona]|nr:hypothetical protein [Saccharopolyspora pogona]
MDEDFEAVISSELALLTPEARADGEAVRALLHDEFSEFSSARTRSC